jgi:hypothetical protein
VLHLVEGPADVARSLFSCPSELRFYAAQKPPMTFGTRFPLVRGQHRASDAVLCIHYEGALFSLPSPRTLLLSHSSYFWPLGMVAHASERTCCSKFSLLTPLAPLSQAWLRSRLGRLLEIKPDSYKNCTTCALRPL